MLLLLSACMGIDYPDDFIQIVMFTSHVVDVDKFQITTKDELLEFVDTAKTWGSRYDGYSGKHNFYNSHFYKGRLVVRPIPDGATEVYIKPFSRGVAILDGSIYEFGMPINIRNQQKGVILIKGNPEWADPSYNGFTILPICSSADDCIILDFTWKLRF